MASVTGEVRGGQSRQPSSAHRATLERGVWAAVLLAGIGIDNRAVASTPRADPLPPEARTEAVAPIDLDGAPLEGRTEARRARPKDSDVHLDGLMLLHLGDGLGAGGQLRVDRFALRATLGYEPLLFVVDDDPQDQTLGDIEFSHSAQLNLDCLLLATKSEIGASVGYRYNTLLGHGVAVAFQSMFDLWRQRFAFSIPVMYFPEGTERVRDEHGLSSEYRINFPFGAGIQYGVGVAWLL